MFSSNNTPKSCVTFSCAIAMLRKSGIEKKFFFEVFNENLSTLIEQWSN